MTLKLKAMHGMQQATTRYSVQNDTTIGTFDQSPKHTTMSGHKMMGGDSTMPMNSDMKNSHCPTGADAADQAMTQSHMDAMDAPKKKSDSHAMPTHGGRRANKAP